MRKTVLVTVTALATVGIYLTQGGPKTEITNQTEYSSDTAIVAISVPDTLTESAQIGKPTFDAKCAACHGPNAVGQLEVAPPLVHEIYEPSHHGDEAFQLAVAIGVHGHHWPFGNMPPVEGLSRGDVQMIVAYIRELQRANGIN